MKKFWLAVSALTTLVGVGLCQNSPTVQPSDERIAQLIKQLGSEKYAEREKATLELDAIGLLALPQLRLASKSKSLEAARRAGEIVKKFEDKLAIEALLAPKKVKLSFKDKSVLLAIEELKKQTGYSILLASDSAPLDERKISLDTGETTFWDAFDSLCKVSNLVEQRTGLEVAQIWNAWANQLVKLGPWPDSVQPIKAPLGTEEILVRLSANVVIGKGSLEKTFISQHRALRILLFPANRDARTLFRPKKADEFYFGIELSAEPGKHLRIVGYRIEKATDDMGQAMVPVMTTIDELDPELSFVEIVLRDGSRVPLKSLPPAIVIGFKRGDNVPTRIRELIGTLTVEGLTDSRMVSARVPFRFENIPLP